MYVCLRVCACVGGCVTVPIERSEEASGSQFFSFAVYAPETELSRLALEASYLCMLSHAAGLKQCRKITINFQIEFSCHNRTK